MARPPPRDTTGPSGTPSRSNFTSAVVGHHAAPEPLAGARDVDEPRRHQPAGQRLGHGQREPPLHEQARHRAAPSSRRRRRRPASPSTARSSASSASRRACAVASSCGLGRDPDLDALDAAGQEGDGGVAGARRAPRCRGATSSATRRLGLAPGAQRAAAGSPPSRPARPEVGDHGPLEHLLHLVGHAGHGVDHLVADRADRAPGRCPGAGG